MTDFWARHIRCYREGDRIVRHDIDCKHRDEHEQRSSEAQTDFPDTAQCVVCLETGRGREPVCGGCLQIAGDILKTEVTPDGDKVPQDDRRPAEATSVPDGFVPIEEYDRTVKLAQTLATEIGDMRDKDALRRNDAQEIPAPNPKCGWCKGGGFCIICQARPSSPETYADDSDPRRLDAQRDDAAKGLDDHALAGMLEYLARAIDISGASVADEDLSRNVREARNRARWLRERAALRRPEAPPDAKAWNARLFEQFNLGLETGAHVVDRYASIHRMRAQSFADDSDRADGEAQADDVEREEKAAELLEYVASRIRAMLPRQRRAAPSPIEQPQRETCSCCQAIREVLTEAGVDASDTNIQPAVLVRRALAASRDAGWNAAIDEAAELFEDADWLDEPACPGESFPRCARMVRALRNPGRAAAKKGGA